MIKALSLIMSLNEDLEYSNVDSDDLTVSSDELDYQVDNIDLNKEVLKKQYAIIKKIGKGSFANVWLSYDTINNIFVAIKVQHPDNYDEGIDELKFLMRLNKYNNSNINNVLDGFIDVRKDKEGKKKYVCMVFGLLAGNLYDVIKEGKYSNGLPINIIKNITKQLLLSIKLINNKMDAIHGDIKPENILIEGVNKNCELIIEEYKKLDFKSEFTKRKNEFLKAKEISLNNKAKIKKAFNKKIKSKIRKIIHAEFMNKLQIYMDDSSSDDESSYYTDSEDEEELANYSNEEEENNLVEKKDNYLKEKIDDSVEEIDDSDEEYDSDEEDDSDEDFEVIDDKYLINCKIKLSDFGNACYNDEKYIDEFGTRYYRAPEIILEHEYNNTCDVWSIGCTIFELLTGDLLFNPEKDKINNRDVHHLHCIEKICGKIPKDFLKKCNRKDDFYDTKNNLKNINKPEKIGINEILSKYYNLEENEIKDLIDFLEKILVYQPDKRITVEQCLKHKWLQ